METDRANEAQGNHQEGGLIMAEDWLTVEQVFLCHAEFGRLDREKVKVAMGPNWPKEWDKTVPGEGIWEPKKED